MNTKSKDPVWVIIFQTTTLFWFILFWDSPIPVCKPRYVSIFEIYCSTHLYLAICHRFHMWLPFPVKLFWTLKKEALHFEFQRNWTHIVKPLTLRLLKKVCNFYLTFIVRYLMDFTSSTYEEILLDAMFTCAFSYYLDASVKVNPDLVDTPVRSLLASIWPLLES